MATYLVTCATGQQGKAAIKHLLQAGAKIRAVVRNPLAEPALQLKSQGVVLFEGDNDNFEVFRSAAQGCKGLFLCLTPARDDPGSEPRQARGIVQACFGGRRERGAECGLKAYTIIRPGWFHSNYLLSYGRYHIPGLVDKVEFVHAIDDGVRLPHIDVDDIGKYVAAALLDPEKFGGEEFEFANENLTAREAWEILRKASGRDIGFQRRSPAEEEAAKAVISTQKFHLWANRKDIQIDGQEVQNKYGILLTSLEEYLEREKDLLSSSLSAK